MARNTPRATAARVIIVFALLASAVAVSTWRDSRRTDNPAISWPTAVGDRTLHKPGGPPLHVAVNGRLYSLNEEPGEVHLCRDDRMWHVPLAVAEPRLYTTSEVMPANALPLLFLKTGDGEYLRVTLEPVVAGDGGTGAARR